MADSPAVTQEQEAAVSEPEKDVPVDTVDMTAHIKSFVDQGSEPWTGFKKCDHLKISELQLKHKVNEKNRLSNKLNRRDVSYFDLYALHEPADEFAQIRSGGGFPYTKQDM